MDQDAEARQQQSLEEINQLTENLHIATSELREQNEENSNDPDSSDGSSSESEDGSDESSEDSEGSEDNEPMATKQKLPDPPRFAGDRNKLQLWLHQLDVKINGNSERFPDSNIKISYAFELLEGEALKWAEQYIDKTDGTFTFTDTTDAQGRITITAYTDFKNKIKAALGDPNPRATAEEAIRTLRQGKNDCTTYSNQFSTHAYELEWDDEAKIAQFKYGLDRKIVKEMIGKTGIPTTFNEYVNYCIGLDNEIRAYEQRYHQYRPLEGSSRGNYQ